MSKSPKTEAGIWQNPRRMSVICVAIMVAMAICVFAIVEIDNWMYCTPDGVRFTDQTANFAISGDSLPMMVYATDDPKAALPRYQGRIMLEPNRDYTVVLNLQEVLKDKTAASCGQLGVFYSGQLNANDVGIIGVSLIDLDYFRFYDDVIYCSAKTALTLRAYTAPAGYLAANGFLVLQFTTTKVAEATDYFDANIESSQGSFGLMVCSMEVLSRIAGDEKWSYFDNEVPSYSNDGTSMQPGGPI